ncbi:MAG: hypothetical protein V8Q85_00195 [Christensenellales bacterium]
MPVTRDLELYAKWSSDVMVQYIVRYKLNSEDGPDVADETVGSAPAGTTRTFEAKGGNDLYADYQTGCFPTTNSHSIKMDVDETKTSLRLCMYRRKAFAIPYSIAKKATWRINCTRTK